MILLSLLVFCLAQLVILDHVAVSAKQLISALFVFESDHVEYLARGRYLGIAFQHVFPDDAVYELYLGVPEEIWLDDVEILLVP